MPVEGGVVTATRAYSVGERGLREGKGYSPEQGQNSRLWAELPWFALETDQTDASTAFPATSRLPVLDVRPRALVHGIVDGHDDLHVRRLRIVVLARHRCEELCLGGVHPIFFVAARDGGELAGGGEGSWSGGGVVIGAGRSWGGLGRQGVRGMWKNLAPGRTGSVVNGAAAA